MVSLVRIRVPLLKKVLETSANPGNALCLTGKEQISSSSPLVGSLLREPHNEEEIVSHGETSGVDGQGAGQAALGQGRLRSTTVRHAAFQKPLVDQTVLTACRVSRK